VPAREEIATSARRHDGPQWPLGDVDDAGTQATLQIASAGCPESPAVRRAHDALRR
jgi:hypothetical protein